MELRNVARVKVCGLPGGKKSAVSDGSAGRPGERGVFVSYIVVN